MFTRREPCVVEHGIQLAEGVGIAMRGGLKHGDCKARRRQRSDAVLVGAEFESDGFARRLQRSIHFAQESLVRLRVEVVQEISDQGEIVIGSEIDIEGAARKGVEALGDAGFDGILLDRKSVV